MPTLKLEAGMRKMMQPALKGKKYIGGGYCLNNGHSVYPHIPFAEQKDSNAFAAGQIGRCPLLACKGERAGRRMPRSPLE